MNLIGGLDSDFEGEISYRGKNLRDYTAQELADYHKKSIGFIFQNFNLIPHLNLIDNVALAMTLSNIDKETRVKRAKELLEKVGLKAISIKSQIRSLVAKSNALRSRGL